MEVDLDDVEFRRAPSPAEQFSKPFPVERRTPRRSRGKSKRFGRIARRSRCKCRPMANRCGLMARSNRCIGSPRTTGRSVARQDRRTAISRKPACVCRRFPSMPGIVRVAALAGRWCFDFSALDDSLAYVLGLEDSIRVILYASLEPYPEFCDRHPEAAWVDAGASWSAKRNTLATPRRAARRAAGPLADRARLSRRRQRLSPRLARHLNTSPLGKAVVGLHIVAGTDGQWFSPDWRPGASDYDYSEGARAAFGRLASPALRRDLAAFRKAWGNESLAFETATLPPDADRSPDKWFLDPAIGADRRVIDANLFSDAGKMETLNAFARASRKPWAGL